MIARAAMTVQAVMILLATAKSCSRSERFVSRLSQAVAGFFLHEASVFDTLNILRGESDEIHPPAGLMRRNSSRLHRARDSRWRKLARIF